jgi:hypothetical protein
MTPEAQRIAIAEACGWKKAGHYWTRPDHKACDALRMLPDYLNDLNAMHEAEKVLTEPNKWNYGNTLALMVLSKERAYFGEKEDAEPNLNGFGHFALATLTAAQRAEAFLRTLGIWK